MIPGIVASQSGGPAAPPLFAGYPFSVVADGTNDRLSSTSVAGKADNANCTMYAKFSTTVTPAARILYLIHATSAGFGLWMQSKDSDAFDGGYLRCRFENPSGQVIWEAESDIKVNDGKVYEVFVSVNNNTGAAYMYIGEAGVSDAVSHVNVLNTTRLGSGDLIDYTKTTWTVLSQDTGGNKWEGEVYRVAMWDQQAYDVTDAAVRDQLRDWRQLGSGDPINFYGPVETWNAGQNEGDGGNFTVSGSFTAGTGSPILRANLVGSAFQDSSSTTLSITLSDSGTRDVFIFAAVECTALPTFATLDGISVTNNINTVTNGGADGFYDATAGKAIFGGRVSNFTGTGTMDLVISGGGSITRWAAFVFAVTPGVGPSCYLYPDPGPQLTESGFWQYKYGGGAGILVAMGEGATAGAGVNNYQQTVVPPTLIGGSTYVMVGAENFDGADAWKSPQPSYDVNGTNLTKDIGVGFTILP